MKRRDFFAKAGIGSAALVTLPAFRSSSKDEKSSGSGQQDHDHEQEHGHDGRHDDMNGPLASANVSFGQWNLDTPLDRFPNNSDRTRNNHHLIPGVVTIKAGGSVNFIIAGFHHVLIYGPGTKPADINRAVTMPVSVPPGPALINDPVNRVYRGLDPSVFPVLPGTPPQPLQDRVETVRFPNPGTYLVICGVLAHFFDATAQQFVMFGYVRVKQ
jgi:hypothetical protein